MLLVPHAAVVILSESLDVAREYITTASLTIFWLYSEQTVENLL